jgi:hypothetical protein
MNFFDKLKVTIKQKWLDYYQINCDWLLKFGSWVKTPDTGTRPNSATILGAITALEPQLAEFMPAFCDLNPEAERLIEALGLNFDPRKELEKRAAEIAASQETEIIPLLANIDTEYLNKIREETKT